MIDTFFLTDSWWIEGDIAWFIGIEEPILFEYSFASGEYRIISRIPKQHAFGYRAYCRCIKHEDYIYCLPNQSDAIWGYSLKKNLWIEIKIPLQKKVFLRCHNYIIKKNTLYIYSSGLNEVLTIDLNENILISTQKVLDVSINAISVYKNNFIFLTTKKIYRYNLLEKKLYDYNIYKIDDDINTISYDGKIFWLTGRKRKIYLCQNNKVKVLDNFPDDFGEYDFGGKSQHILNCKLEVFKSPIFIKSLLINQYIWLIPFQTNQIIFINIFTHKINTFDIKEEKRSWDDLKNYFLLHMYLFEYTRDEINIGLMSLKNQEMIEINTKTLEYKKLKCSFINKNFEIFRSIIFQESIQYHKEIYNKLIKTFKINNQIADVGKKINNINRKCSGLFE